MFAIIFGNSQVWFILLADVRGVCR